MRSSYIGIGGYTSIQLKRVDCPPRFHNHKENPFSFFFVPRHSCTQYYGILLYVILIFSFVSNKNIIGMLKQCQKYKLIHAKQTQKKNKEEDSLDITLYNLYK